jgi:hypothetical protein
MFRLTDVKENHTVLRSDGIINPLEQVQTFISTTTGRYRSITTTEGQAKVIQMLESSSGGNTGHVSDNLNIVQIWELMEGSEPPQLYNYIKGLKSKIKSSYN